MLSKLDEAVLSQQRVLSFLSHFQHFNDEHCHDTGEICGHVDFDNVHLDLWIGDG